MRGRGQESVLGTSSLTLASIALMSASELDVGGSNAVELGGAEAVQSPQGDPGHVITLTATDFALKLGTVRTSRPKDALELHIVLPTSEQHEQWVYGLALLRNLTAGLVYRS